jgi:hypothetical protein
MIQLYTEQVYDSLVNEVPELDDDAYLFLDPSKSTVIREIAAEGFGGIVATAFPSSLTVGFSSRAFTDVTLVPSKGDAQTTFYAPSHASSPAVTGVAVAILRVREAGFRVDKNAKLSVSRAIGAHVYVDQTDQ